MAAAGRLSPFQDEADLRAAPEDLSSASDSGSQTPGLQNGRSCLHGRIACTQMQHPCTLLLPAYRTRLTKGIRRLQGRCHGSLPHPQDDMGGPTI